MSIEDAVEGLTTIEKRKAFLQKIWDDDQGVRDGNSSDTDMMNMDVVNVEKVETYLQKYGYPTKDIYEDLALVPWVVIHHASGYEIRERHIKTIYSAYKNGDIDDGAMSFYLGRMHHIKFGERFRMKSPFMPDDEIDSLISIMDLKKLL